MLNDYTNRNLIACCAFGSCLFLKHKETNTTLCPFTIVVAVVVCCVYSLANKNSIFSQIQGPCRLSGGIPGLWFASLFSCGGEHIVGGSFEKNSSSCSISIYYRQILNFRVATTLKRGWCSGGEERRAVLSNLREQRILVSCHWNTHLQSSDSDSLPPIAPPSGPWFPGCSNTVKIRKIKTRWCVVIANNNRIQPYFWAKLPTNEGCYVPCTDLKFLVRN